MEEAGVIPEVTLQLMAETLNSRNTAWVPVTDQATQTEPELVVHKHDIRSLLDATLSLHNQKIRDKELYLNSKQYRSREVQKTRIRETLKNSDGLDGCR